MQICGDVSRKVVLAALPIVAASYRIKSLLDCTASRKRVSSSLKSNQ